ncbi:MAG: class I SAM-dependent methyltransferase [Asgard group archaeon]|nr:class I SAM-dependent methyltransferase [Asgard group archaeon]
MLILTKKSLQVGWDWEKVKDLSYWKIPDGYVANLPYHIKKSSAKVLDLGCGVGRHTIYFASIGYDVCAMDISDEAVRSTKEWLKEEGLIAQVEKGQMTNLPYPDKTFDLVLAYNVIYHAYKHDVIKTISEITRVLKPNGHLFLTILTKDPNIPFYGTGIIDEQTIIKQEEPEKGIPHFFFKIEDVFDLFKNFDFLDMYYKEWYSQPITLERVNDRKGNGHYILFAQKREK